MISKTLKTALFVAGLSVALAGNASADHHGSKYQEGASGAMLAAPCAGCHGPNGNSEGAAPSIAGTAAEDMVAAMNDFKAGKRSPTIMNRIAKGYNDADIKALAKYFAAQ